MNTVERKEPSGAARLLIDVGPLVIFFLGQRFFVQGIVTSGIKG